MRTTHLSLLMTFNLGSDETVDNVEFTSPMVNTPPSVFPVVRDRESWNVMNCCSEVLAWNIWGSKISDVIKSGRTGMAHVLKDSVTIKARRSELLLDSGQ